MRLLALLPVVLAAAACQSLPEGVREVRSADGVVIRYDVRGSGAPAVVFIHGWSCDRTVWNAQMERYATDRRVVALDLAGHGESGQDRGQWTVEAFGADVAAVCDAEHLDEVFLVGHSMGGAVAIEAAQILGPRVRGLVAVDTFHDVDRHMTEEQIEGFVAPFRQDYAKHCDEAVRKYFFQKGADPALVDRMARMMAARPPEVAIPVLEALYHYDVARGLEGVESPVRCINSSMRPTNMEAARRHHANFDVVQIAGVGHFLMMEDPEAFARRAREVLLTLNWPQ